MDFHSRRDAIDAGIGAVYQNLGLVDQLPAPANVFLGDEPTVRILGIPFLNVAKMRRDAVAILREKVGIELADLDGATHDLSGGQRQAVTIARAVYHTDLKVLVMDEPTAALGPEETRNTLRLVRSVRDRGLAVILGSHNLEHVFAVADRVHAMRAGRRAGVVEVAQSSRREVLGLIVGAEEGLDADAVA